MTPSDDKLTEAELSRRLTEAAVYAKPGAQYRHYKGPTYTVTELAITEATNEPAVVYHPDYLPGVSFIRPLSNWRDTVQWDDQTVPRFARVIDEHKS